MHNMLPDTVVIQDQLSAQGHWLLFKNPVAIVETNRIDQVADCLETVEQYTQQGLYAVGFISYEAASAMDSALEVHTPSSFPLIWFAICDACETIDLPQPGEKNFHLGEWQPSISWDEYHAGITRIRQHILEGDTYQVNYTMRLRNRFAGDAWNFFLTLYQAQRSGYSAFLNLGRYQICSVSPELFFSLQNDKITCKPMKGTIKRGLTSAEDRKKEQWLSSSEKNRAENLMIVDMIRNDIGTLAKTGTVCVEKLFSIEKYPTVHQMTSTVTADVSSPASEILRKMFPCASISGAPKVKTMEIIKNLEKDPRGIYTGSIGYIAPGGKTAQFNVAIRTVVIDSEKNSAEYGVGGGIVWDSESKDEYEECKAKAAVLVQENQAFGLIESILWDGDQGFYLLDEHLDRLFDSADYFQFDMSADELHAKLDEFRQHRFKDRRKVRIELSRTGQITLEAQPVTSIAGYRVGLALHPVPVDSPFLYHKTTRREIYQAALKSSTFCQDVILWNEAGCITESSIANVVIDYQGELITPPIDQGLLAGILRRDLLGKGIVKEKNITKTDLYSAQRLFLINSVRGWMELEKSREDDGTWVLKNDFLYVNRA